jgi:hypothetical protein
MDTSNIRKHLIQSGHGVVVNRISYFKATKKWLNIRNPKTWSEKLFWLNKYWQPEEKAICADKYRVREWIAKKGYADILLPLHGIYNKAEDIDFDELPNRFVLKCNHGCACNVIVEDKSKLDISEARRKLNGWLKRDYSLAYNEAHYHNIPPKIICEQFLPVDSYSDVVDFKIHCFNGTPRWIGICFDREKNGKNPKEMIFSPEWDRLMYLKSDRKDDGKWLDKPKNLDRMLEIAKVFSKDFPYVRVDLYSVGEQIFFGELTFTPSGNMPEDEYAKEVAKIAGDYLDLSKVNKTTK